MTAAPSQTPEAAGLEVVGWVKRINESHPINLAQPSDWKFTPHKPVLSEGLQAEWFDEREVVTAASAQAAIDAEKARADRLAKALEPFAAMRVLEPNGVVLGMERLHFEQARAALQQETQP